MNTTQPPFDDLKVRQAVNYAINPDDDRKDLRRRTRADPADPAAGVPGYEKFDLYPYDMAKAKSLIKEANPSDRNITVWTDSLNEEAGESFEAVLEEIGFNAKLKVVNADNYFTVIGNEKTPDLDIGWAGFGADYPQPERLLPTAARRREHPADQQHEPLPDRRPDRSTKKIEKLRDEALGPAAGSGIRRRSTRHTWNRRRWRPTANQTASLFVSSEINFGDGHLEPDLLGRPDQLPVQVVAGPQPLARRLPPACGRNPVAIGSLALFAAVVVFVLAAPLWADNVADTGPERAAHARKGSKSTAKRGTSSAPTARRSARSGSAPTASSSSAPTAGSGATRWCGSCTAGAPRS